ncbi:hypothetical protein [Obesumbacterium proteus]|mgnify:CR=1 FL=1|uniref:hypothetical protein n=1 Tax=Obesumbacterium proteus TaxID=82983 RepID=UPI00242DDAB2|nr:hypothetical protein [Obesumbacterium proteus]
MLPLFVVEGRSAPFIPSNDQLRKHARFLRNHCEVPLGHAQEMVAYFYHFSSWSDMISRSSMHFDKSVSARLAEMREYLQRYRDKITDDELSIIVGLNAMSGTLTEAIEKDRITQLNDLDVFNLYNCLSDTEYWGSPELVSWDELLYEKDRCLVLLAKRMAGIRDLNSVNPHLYFPWFGFRMYGYLNLNGKQLNYECRELDSYLFPSPDKIRNLFKRPWFISYFIGFIRSLLNSLCQSEYSGVLTFSRICNEGLIEKMVSIHNKKIIYKRYSCNGNTYTDIPVANLVNTMLAMGGKLNNARQSIEFSFGCGESY